MTRNEKLISRFLAQPTNLSYNEIEKVLILFDFEKIHTKGSHNKFKHPKSKYDLVIPVHNNECKDFYKKLASKTIKELNNLH
ncbi:MAG: type II toxin-antitoxin system HicA family toxin [Candidatus Gracilibacteria bacterium]|jgi:predicted RNA binding protein YcfA (HicA-like mRNA interferase family)|nr:type II toxin-antitoxin system HicA family toxin [Candidatus Gracilibacteria bacterium]